jgi:prepilin-type N-terminal cleavage/methylation domain-containing protein
VTDRALSRTDGFTLIEALVATTILTIGVVSVAHLTIMSRNSAQSAWRTTTAAVLAQGEMERLRSAAWPATASVTCCEFFDADARWLAAGDSPPMGTAYARRTSIESLPLNPGNVWLVQVTVTPARASGAITLIGVRSRRVG